MTMPKLDRAQVTNLLTLIIVAVWIATAVVRMFRPWPEAAIIDSAMPLVIGYWFASTAAGKRNDNGHNENGASA
jgi:hypothetical protein